MANTKGGGLICILSSTLIQTMFGTLPNLPPLMAQLPLKRKGEKKKEEEGEEERKKGGRKEKEKEKRRGLFRFFGGAVDAAAAWQKALWKRDKLEFEDPQLFLLASDPSRS